MRYKPEMLPELEKAICYYYAVDNNFLRERSRREDKVLPRQVFQYIAYEERYSFKRDIARYLGFSHATVLSNIRNIESAMKFNKRIREDVNYILDMVKEREIELNLA